MTKHPYSELLKDPRWQKKRLKILERDNFTCQFCESTKNELHVHHIKYSGKPWDIEDKYLKTLCKECHESITLSNGCAKYLLQEIESTFDVNQIYGIHSLIQCVFENKPNDTELEILCIMINRFKHEDYNFYYQKYNL